MVTKTQSVINEFNNWRKQPDVPEAVSAIKVMALVMCSSQATTMMELEFELEKASDSLKLWDTTSISLTAACDLFIRYVTRLSALEYEDFNSAKSHLIERAEKFGESSPLLSRNELFLRDVKVTCIGIGHWKEIIQMMNEGTRIRNK